MAIRDKSYLKEKFETGKIPTGQDFADFIETFVASINGETPNVATGDVPYIGQYNNIHFLPPDVRWDDDRYPEGLSVFIAEFTEDDTDWITVFGDVVPPFGQLVVLTNKNYANNYCFQEVDAMGKGPFNPQYSRSINADGTWKPLSKMTPVKTINGNSPDIYGNIAVSTGTTVEVVDNLTTNSSTKALSAKQGVELYDEVLGIISQISYHFYRMAEVDLPAHVSPDGTTIEVTEEGVISVNPDALAYNAFDRSTSGKLLDARAGKFLYDRIPTKFSRFEYHKNMGTIDNVAIFTVPEYDPDKYILDVYDAGILCLMGTYTVTFLDATKQMTIEWTQKTYPTVLSVRGTRLVV